MVLTANLVNQGQCYLLPEWLLLKGIIITAKQDKEHRDMGSFPHTISIEIQPCTHLVTIFACHEIWTVETCYNTIFPLPRLCTSISDFPNELFIRTAKFDVLDLGLQVTNY